jgi:hypothetical protein
LFDVVKPVVASGLVVSCKEEATLGSAGGPWVCKETALDLDSSGRENSDRNWRKRCSST